MGIRSCLFLGNYYTEKTYGEGLYEHLSEN